MVLALICAIGAGAMLAVMVRELAWVGRRKWLVRRYLAPGGNGERLQALTWISLRLARARWRMGK